MIPLVGQGDSRAGSNPVPSNSLRGTKIKIYHFCYHCGTNTWQILAGDDWICLRCCCKRSAPKPLGM